MYPSLLSLSLSLSHFGSRDLPPPQCSDTSYGALEAAAASAWVFSFGLVFVFVVDRKYIYIVLEEALNLFIQVEGFCTRE